MNTVLDYAKRWINFGASPIPVKTRSKIPIIKWKPWTTQLPTDDLAEQWFARRYHRNIALCCGMNNLTVIDFDSIDYFNTWERGLTKLWKKVLGATYTVSTARGVHFYLQTAEQERTRKDKNGVDIKGANSIVIGAPSVHPSGAVYTDNDKTIIRVDSTLDLFPYPAYPEHADPIPANDTLQDRYDNCDEWAEASRSSMLSIAEIKSMIRIIDIVSGYTRIYRTSVDGRWWMGRCPSISHRDTHPSFRVDAKTNRCTCLSGRCNLYNPRGMDIFDLYQAINGVDLKTAIHDMAVLC